MTCPIDQELKIKDLLLKQDFRLEFLVGQLQTSTEKILCVVDGYSLRWYSEREQIPKGLMFEHKAKGLGVTAYYFRCELTDSLFAFFLEPISRFLCVREEEECVGRIVKISN